MLGGFFVPDSLAGAGGFEPPATGFGDQRSGQTELRSCDVWCSFDAAPVFVAILEPYRHQMLMVPLEGFEPPTRDLGRRRSIL